MQIEQKKSDNLWTVRQILNWTNKRFVHAEIDTPLLDAQLLLSRVLGLSKVQLYIQMDKPLTDVEKSLYRELVKKRLAGEPVAYILKEKFWHNLSLYVDKRVLIPRPETETLLDFILQYKRNESKFVEISFDDQPKVIFDFCTGSGCLAIALAQEFPNSKVVALDISEDALEVAKINAERNGVQNIEWFNLNLCDKKSYEILKKEYGKADIIVANPPYVTESEWQNLDVSVKDYEPKIALVAENEGLKIGKCIVDYLIETDLFSKNCIFGMELAQGQPHSIAKTEQSVLQHNHPMWNIPKNTWFALNDLEEKDRFLLYIYN